MNVGCVCVKLTQEKKGDHQSETGHDSQLGLGFGLGLLACNYA